jgi:hypothetical protein
VFVSRCQRVGPPAGVLRLSEELKVRFRLIALVLATHWSPLTVLLKGNGSAVAADYQQFTGHTAPHRPCGRRRRFSRSGRGLAFARVGQHSDRVR